MSRNTLFLSASKWTPRSEDECLAGWNDFKKFRVYRSGGIEIDVSEFLMIVQSGVTHIGFVFQREDLSVACGYLEVASYVPPVKVLKE